MAAQADVARTAPPAAERVAAADLLGTGVSPVTESDVIALRSSVDKLADGTRIANPSTAGAFLRADRDLQAKLQAGLEDRSIPTQVGVAVTVDLLAADTLTARTMLGDARSLAGAKPDREVKTLLWKADKSLAKAQGLWRKGAADFALINLQDALEGTAQALHQVGLDRYDAATDSDNDSLPDLFEFRAGSDPTRSDTDGDGLTDVFEGTRAAPWHLPNRADTDGDGQSDAEEDLDQDGLTAAEEQSAKTDPVVADSDADGLTDGAEISRHKTDPLNPDTDGDGMQDGAEIRAGLDPARSDTDGDGLPDAKERVTASARLQGVTVELTGVGDLAEDFQIRPVTEGLAAKPGGGRVGPVFDLEPATGSVGKIEKATVTLPYPSTVSEGDDLRVFTFDQSRQRWLPVDGQQRVDATANTVTAELEHFSIYAVFSVKNWAATFTALTGTCARPGTGTPVSKVDVAFVLDSSGSMSGTDPQGLRRTSAKNFVDKFTGGDKGAVVDFDDQATLLQGLTEDKAALRAAIDRIDDSGGTDIGAGVRSGLDELDRETTAGVGKIMLLLTDGGGSYDTALTERAAKNKITIYTVGLSTGVSHSLLQSIASGTGGQYFPVATAADLPQVFREIQEETDDDAKDTDGDGASDCLEEHGAEDAETRILFTSDPRISDTDGDGLPDGAEFGEPDSVTAAQGQLLRQYGINDVPVRYNVNSNPRRVDTDGDNLDDAKETDEETNARLGDTDSDGLNDSSEHELGTDPHSKNTDGDKYTDAYEASHVDQGFDPLVFTEVQGTAAYLRDFTFGFTCGDAFGWCEKDTLAWLLGNISSGFLVFGDVRDAIKSAFDGDLVGLGFAAGGAFPFVGDAVKTAETIVKFLRKFLKNEKKLDQLLRGIATLDKFPNAVKIRVLGTFADLAPLRKAGLGDDAILLLAKKNNMKLLANTVKGAARVEKGVGYLPWREAEKLLRRKSGVTLDKAKGFPTIPGAKGTKGYRFVDCWDEANLIARESKTGYQTVKAGIKRQIERDRQLRTEGKFSDVEWHFFPSERSGTIGGDQELFDLLNAPPKIPYVVHLP